MDEQHVKNCTYLKDHEILECLNNDTCIDKDVKGYATFYGLLEGWSFLINSLGPFAMFHSLLLIDPFWSSFNCLLILSGLTNCLLILSVLLNCLLILSVLLNCLGSFLLFSIAF